MDTRADDKKELQEMLQTASPEWRKKINEIGRTYQNESKKIRDMRERLIIERRKGNTDNVKDINEWVAKHKDYQNE